MPFGPDDENDRPQLDELEQQINDEIAGEPDIDPDGGSNDDPSNNTSDE